MKTRPGPSAFAHALQAPECANWTAMSFSELSFHAEQTGALRCYEDSPYAKQMVLECLYKAASWVASKEMLVVSYLARMHQTLDTSPEEWEVPSAYETHAASQDFWRALIKEDDVLYRALALLVCLGVTPTAWSEERVKQGGFQLAQERTPHTSSYIFRWINVHSARTIYGKAP